MNERMDDTMDVMSAMAQVEAVASARAAEAPEVKSADARIVDTGTAADASPRKSVDAGRVDLESEKIADLLSAMRQSSSQAADLARSARNFEDITHELGAQLSAKVSGFLSKKTGVPMSVQASLASSEGATRIYTLKFSNIAASRNAASTLEEAGINVSDVNALIAAFKITVSDEELEQI